MKPARIFQQYVWLINTLRQYQKLSFVQLQKLWENDHVIGGDELNRNTFMRHKDAILNMFGIFIDCDIKHGYKYYIANPEVINDDSIERWMLSTLTVSSALSDSLAVRDRILLESVPAGEEHLQTIIQALKTKKRVEIEYQRFGSESYLKRVAPYALKLFHQRWYLLAYTGKHLATYSLDRIGAVNITDESFEMPDDFSPEAYYADYYGIMTDDTPLTHVVIRAYSPTPDYLRTLPLHASQKELLTTEDYTDFSYDIHPTYDFINALISHTSGIEVREPEELRHKIVETLEKTLKRY